MPLKHQNMLNRKIKTFTFINVLGLGSFGKVYQAIDERDNTQVAIKVIPKQLMKETPKLDQLVKTQIKVLKKCNNENVIRYVDSFNSVQSIFIVIEFCNERDLEQYLKTKKRLFQQEATEFLKQILNGFKGLHQVDAMHRDFKLANVLLHNGVCKIADLGFAKQMQKEGLTDTVLGTSYTMAPQVFKQQLYGREADIWSIGVVYYQIIYGKYPYQGRSDYQILTNILNTRPDFSEVPISNECRDFIDKCLTVDPKQRIKWQEIYKHPLFAKNEANFAYGNSKSKILINSNMKYYQSDKFAQQQKKYPNIEDLMKKKNFLDVNWNEKIETIQSFNTEKLLQEIKMKKEKERNFNNYEKLYINKRNNIMFIFKYTCPHTNTLVHFKANHGIALFITAKKAYIDMKKILDEVKQEKNIFNIEKDWKQFIKSQIYGRLKQNLECDFEIIQAQAISYMYDIEKKSKEIEAETNNIQKTASKNWQKLVKDTVDEYWYQLAEAMLNYVPSNSERKRRKETVIRVLQALDFYRENKLTDIEQIDKIINALNIASAEQIIKKKIFQCFQ